MSPSYTPVLKARDSELAALGNAALAGQAPYPLIEAVAHSGGSHPRGMLAEALHTAEQVHQTWKAAYLLDVSTIAPATADRALVWSVLATAAPSGHLGSARPVVALNEPAQVLAAAHPIATAAAGAAIRVAMQDARMALPTLAADTARTVAGLGLRPASVDIVLDWGERPASPGLPAIESDTRAALAALGAGWASIIVTGTAAPANPTGTCCTPFKRREWWLWLRLAQGTALPMPVAFGDYAGFPVPTPGTGIAKIATLRYSHGDDLLIVRSRGLQGILGIQNCADQIVAYPGLYCGATFSRGDTDIDAYHRRLPTHATKGNATTWRTISLHHHLALVQHEMANQPPAPPAGTQ